ncbi:hypothetical protein T440DRAFT_511846 [Plenodomus tracheiphilus IPT5]|uniref:Myb-like domain-containing protein n=1 Tax=Plenodomus tracheiphilus IPT5 TaxID=1408161 RepID=A0A6A7AS30_9PLEO|nr:hypothetical protein T440DRAFT_511846 [Plenodomus tracheiphilus IPT5]
MNIDLLLNSGSESPISLKCSASAASSSDAAPTTCTTTDSACTQSAPLTAETPAKKSFVWTIEEDNLMIKFRGQGMKWNDIAEHLPGRSHTSCRQRYQNHLEQRTDWDQEEKNIFSSVYNRIKERMWQEAATELGIPWRLAERMHWELGEKEMDARANGQFSSVGGASLLQSRTRSLQLPASNQRDIASKTSNMGRESCQRGKREGEKPSYGEPYPKKRRDEEAEGPFRPDSDACSQGIRTSDRLSHLRSTASVHSLK